MGLVICSCNKKVDNSASSASSQQLRQQSGIVSVPDAYFNDLFTRYGGGWTGGDGAFSCRLPDGRDVWIFGDSFLDTVYPDRSRPFAPLIHNCLVVTDAAGNFTTLHGGTTENPEPYFIPREAGQYYWPTGLFDNPERKELYIFLDRIQPGAHGGFKTAGIDIAIIGLPSLKLQKIVHFYAGGEINWGATFLADGNYVYMYGTESVKYNKYIHVARIDRDNPLHSLRYYDGNTWVADSSKSARIKGGVSEFYSLFKSKEKYYLLSQGKLLTPDIFIWDAAGPAGPFGGQRLVYTTPETQGTVFTYNPTVNTQFTENGQLLVGYSTNSTDFLSLFENADYGRPFFIRVSNWERH